MDEKPALAVGREKVRMLGTHLEELAKDTDLAARTVEALEQSDEVRVLRSSKSTPAPPTTKESQ